MLHEVLVNFVNCKSSRVWEAFGGGLALVSDGAALAALASRDRVATAHPPRVRLVNANGAGDVMAARLFFDLTDQPDMALSDRLQAALAAGADYAAGPTV